LAVAFLAFITEENDPAILAGNLELCAGYRTINFEGLTVHKYRGAFLFSQELYYFLGIGGHAGGKTVFLQEIYQTMAERPMQYHNDYRGLVFSGQVLSQVHANIVEGPGVTRWPRPAGAGQPREKPHDKIIAGPTRETALRAGNVTQYFPQDLLSQFPSQSSCRLSSGSAAVTSKKILSEIRLKLCKK
jgi:hypothetical protein